MSIVEWRVSSLGDTFQERWSHSCWTVQDDTPSLTPRKGENKQIKPLYLFGGSTRFNRFNDIVKLTCSTTGQWSSETISSNEKKKKEGLFSVGKFKKSSKQLVVLSQPCERDGHTTCHYSQSWSTNSSIKAEIEQDEEDDTASTIEKKKNTTKIVLFGGTDGKKFLNDVWIYDPFDGWKEETFDKDKSRPEGRSHHSAIVRENRLYVYGGKNDKKTFSDLWVLDLETMVS
jgi:hypothetical protein